MSGRSAHVEGCGCARCRGFEVGNRLAVTHGARSTITLAPRAAAIAAELRSVVPGYSPSDEPTIALTSLVLARIESCANWLDEHGVLDEQGAPRPVLRSLSTTENTAARLLDRLGLTPTARARLGLDVALAHRASERALDALEATGRAVIARRNGGGDE